MVFPVVMYRCKSWAIKKKEKGVTEDERVRRHHHLSGQKFEQTQGGSEGQGSLACCPSTGSQKVGHN